MESPARLRRAHQLAAADAPWAPRKLFRQRCLYDCALHGVSPRDRWLCVLPRWRMNVNVNVSVAYIPVAYALWYTSYTVGTFALSSLALPHAPPTSSSSSDSGELCQLRTMGEPWMDGARSGPGAPTRLPTWEASGAFLPALCLDPLRGSNRGPADSNSIQ